MAAKLATEPRVEEAHMASQPRVFLKSSTNTPSRVWN